MHRFYSQGGFAYSHVRCASTRSFDQRLGHRCGGCCCLLPDLQPSRCNHECRRRADRSTRLLAATTLRNVLGTRNLAEILSERESISTSMQVSRSGESVEGGDVLVMLTW
ncbi:hypothetical protein AHF37_12226, partial [Paragonimus kellicotti]